MTGALFWMWVGGMVPVLAVISTPDPQDGRREPWPLVAVSLALWPVLMAGDLVTRLSVRLLRRG